MLDGHRDPYQEFLAFKWSDSLNELWWIRGISREFKPFVANRVGEIQSGTNPEKRRCIPTSFNPADILRRSMSVLELLDCDMWWRGPDYFRQLKATWPARNIQQKPTGYDEMKRPIRLQKEKLRTREQASKQSTACM